MAHYLADKIAVVTGGGRGIGRAIALRLADEGATVVVNDNGARLDGTGKSRAPADSAVTAIRSRKGAAAADYSDASSYAVSKRLIEGVVERYGRMDILVNSFGAARPKLLTECAQEDLDLLIDVMLKGKLYCTQHAARQMVKQGSGRIINLASSMGLVTMTRRVAYGAAQVGIIGFSNVAAIELGPYGVTVNTICPGATTSRLTDDAIRVARAHLKHPIISATEISTAQHRPAPPDDIATLTAYLCTDFAKEINGQVFHAAGSNIGLPELMRRPHEVWQAKPWTIEHLIKDVPATLMKGVTNVPQANR